MNVIYPYVGSPHPANVGRFHPAKLAILPKVPVAVKPVIVPLALAA